MNAAAKLLVVGPSWVGDMVMAQALYRMLVTRRDSLQIDVLAPPWSLPLLERMPEIARGVKLDVGHGQLQWGVRRKVAASLEAAGYAQAIVLPRSFKSALVPYLAKIPRRTGFLGELRFGLINDIRPLERKRLDKTVLRFMALGLESAREALPKILLPRLRADPLARAALIDRLRLDASGPVVAMMPGAEYGPAKQWPVQYFAAVAARLDAAGVVVWILGSDKERALGERLRKAAPAAHNLCGQTSLPEVVDLLSVSQVAVSNDSGLMHVAAAVGTHVVALYGSSSPDFTPPLTAAKSVLYEHLSCSPCHQRTCPLDHLRCLHSIGVDQVYAATLTALGSVGEQAATHV